MRPKLKPEIPVVPTREEKRAERVARKALRLRTREKKSEADSLREFFIVTGTSKIGRIRRVYPTRAEAERDADDCRRRKCQDVQIRSNKEK